MRYFTNRSLLARMDLNTKLIMTYFLVFMLAGSAFSIYMSFERTGLDTEGATAYYAGDEEGMQFPKEATELTETTHFHFFIMPIIFMTTGHLFLMSAWSQRWKTFVISSCFVYIALDLAKPWLIRYGAPGFGILAPINSALLGITMLLCIVVPLYEMWFLRIERSEHPH
ncbi:MAG: hypothetical protein CME24_12055 [Gemmatimonadetes bacterium]|nr:hypothetical protein [Gemmatimonadota bacterium]|tara:strand:- start:265 stop:771 length:507 start_codon:yes stop_codon:yes gene_type:complete